MPHAPEGTSLALVEGIKREYALHDVFSREVGDAHLSGDLHLHGLGYIDRPYSAFQSLEYLKRFGLKLPHSVTVAGPARHAEVLLAHMVRFGASLQGHFAGVIGWDAINLSFAPYLAGMGERELEQFAQMLIYEFSQLTSSRGGRRSLPIFISAGRFPTFSPNSPLSAREGRTPAEPSGSMGKMPDDSPGRLWRFTGRGTPRESRSFSPGPSSTSRMRSSEHRVTRHFWSRFAALPLRRGILAWSSIGKTVHASSLAAVWISAKKPRTAPAIPGKEDVLRSRT